MLAQHVPPAAVQEAVEDVRGDDVRQRGRRLRLEGRLQAQRRAGQDGAHIGEPRDREPMSPKPRVELRKQLNWKSSGAELKYSEV